MASREEMDLEVGGYLRELRGHLRGVPHAEVEEIVRELESHIKESLGTSYAGATAEVLDRLGTPRDLASQYRTSRAVSGFAWTRASLHGVSMLGVAFVGYFLSASLLAAAALKPFFPTRTGLWRSFDGESYSLRLGLGTALQPGEEILGWLMIPIGIALGGFLFLGVTRYAQSTLAKVRIQTGYGCQPGGSTRS